MQYSSFVPKIISNPMASKQASRKIQDGILETAMLSPFQKNAIDGIVSSAMPGKPEPVKKNKISLVKIKPSKTKQDIGSVHFPGSKFV